SRCSGRCPSHHRVDRAPKRPRARRGAQRRARPLGPRPAPMKSLAGRSVVITRAGDQADATVELVRSFDATPILVPLIEIVDEPIGMAEIASHKVANIELV